MPQNAKKINQLEILKVIQRFQPLAIRDIAQLCNLSIPTICVHIDELLNRGVLCDMINEKTEIGRKPRLISINPSHQLIVGVDLGLETAELAICDLMGDVLETRPLPLADMDGQAVYNALVQALDSLWNANRHDQKAPAVIVVGNPGIVNEDGSLELPAPSATWADLPLRTLLAGHFQTEVCVVNDHNLAAIGEKEYGVGKGYANFAYVRNDVGLKAGIILNNRLWQGEHKAAGEISLNLLSGKKMRAHLNEEKAVSYSGIMERIRDAMGDHPDDILSLLLDGKPQALTLEALERALQSPNCFAAKILEDVAQTTGCMLANLVNVLDISLLVFGGQLASLGNVFLKPLRQTLETLLFHTPTVLLSSLGDQAGLYGALAVGVDYALESLLRKQ